MSMRKLSATRQAVSAPSDFANLVLTFPRRGNLARMIKDLVGAVMGETLGLRKNKAQPQ
jgi:hypothetical protein